MSGESKELIDPDRMLHLELTIGFKPIDQPCCLCCLPVGREYPVIEVVTHPGGALERYCEECYRCLWIEGHHFMTQLPDPEDCFDYEGVVEPGVISCRNIEVPCYLVKGDGLKLFKPTDPAEVGRIRAANLKLREEDLNDTEETLS